jgi:NTE family protein
MAGSKILGKVAGRKQPASQSAASPPKRAAHAPRRYVLDLALQGGGAHGAFTWGVLDRLLEETDIDIDGISGTSAGAMNGAMLVCGYVQNGREGARALLSRFWEAVADAGSSFAPLRGPMEQLGTTLGMDGFFAAMMRLWSPYEFNPFNLNPLRSVLEKMLDIEALRSNHGIKLFVTATNVHTGHPRIFGCEELSVDALLASACLPFLYQAIKIDGVPYWDGGYAGNPVIWPLIYETRTEDVLLVQLNPLARLETPSSGREIVNRVNEITFNAPLIAEMRAIDFVGRMIQENRLDTDRYRGINMHMISMQDTVADLDASGKMNIDGVFLRGLFASGREAASQWLVKNKALIGVRGSVNIRETFLSPREPGDGGTATNPLHRVPPAPVPGRGK